jgi:hypothetical protein
MYYLGEGAPQDVAKGHDWFTKAAEQGHPSAQFNLGVIYQTGTGVRQDSGAAAAWFGKAAAQGHRGAQFNLAILYSSGPSKDLVRAYMWADLAFVSGERRAGTLRESLEAAMTPEQITEARRRSRQWKPERR